MSSNQIALTETPWLGGAVILTSRAGNSQLFY